MFVAYPPCEGCQWLSSGQLWDQQSSPWLCSLVNQNLCRCFELISWLACHHILICWDGELVGFCLMGAKIITIKRTKDLNYFSLCALNLFNTRVTQFELNYWNKWTFPRHSNLLKCTCIQQSVIVEIISMIYHMNVFPFSPHETAVCASNAVFCMSVLWFGWCYWKV